MPGISARPTVATLLLLAAFRSASLAEEEIATAATEVVISVADQKMVVLREGMWVEKYKISTSKFGLGDSYGSYKTPVGKLRVCDKIGEGLPLGSVIKHRNATGEVLPVNAPGRDPIVTRILWLEGLEQRNANAKSRGIYIHGTVEEEKIGNPVSYGCIRMRSRDVVNAFEELPLGTLVTIQQEKLPHYKRWSPAPTLILASRGQPKTTVKVVPEKEKERMVAADAEKKSEPTKTEPSAKPETKLVAAKTTVPEKSTSKTTPAPNAPTQSKVAATKPAETEPAATSTNEPRVTVGGTAALAALKGSILFSDIPGHGPKVEGLTSSSAAKTTPDPEAETAAASEQLPRVTFRAPVGQRLLR